MNLADRGSGPEGLAWRFPRKGCKKEVYALEHFLKVKEYKIFFDNRDCHNSSSLVYEDSSRHNGSRTRCKP